MKWADLGSSFPSLKNAYSTDYYRDCERLLIKDNFPNLREARVLKTDLWNEARSTELLFWLSEQGANGVGVDIALSTARLAMSNRNGHRAHMLVADVRDLPFAEGSFDYIYSMGTIEHMPDYQQAAAELYRVLAPGGRAIIGVPNLHDPFLRPLTVGLLSMVGKYPYSPEKAFSSKALRHMLSDVGFQVRGVSGALFMPGWLRMLDLLLHTKNMRLAALTARCTKPFAWLYKKFPKLRRHSYLVAAIVERPLALPDVAAFEKAASISVIHDVAA
ncbi:MAG: methyltransferase domain-containing protein [Desulfarculaceae bacterium]|nr:methyltransferase domain-containing protein [Desulfarculaceae bacterium]MCF8097238.1 methyltransferase domain-containing protein [Desulfarculaceae bacterium]